MESVETIRWGPADGGIRYSPILQETGDNRLHNLADKVQLLTPQHFDSLRSLSASTLRTSESFGMLITAVVRVGIENVNDILLGEKHRQGSSAGRAPHS